MVLGMVLIGDERPAFVLEVGDAARARAVEVGQERDHGAGQRRVLRLQQ